MHTTLGTLSGSSPPVRGLSCWYERDRESGVPWDIKYKKPHSRYKLYCKCGFLYWSSGGTAVDLAGCVPAKRRSLQARLA
eukprot:2759124-Rhodomonas_salina.1